MASDQASVLVALGDSITRGYPLISRQSYPALLQIMLRGAGLDEQGVINAGVPGDTAIMGVARYARDVSDHYPNIVLISFGLNDGALRRTQFDARREQLWRAMHDPAIKLDQLVERMRQRLGIADGWQSGPETVREALPRVSEAAYIGALTDLVDVARRDGARPILLSMTPVAHDRVHHVQRHTYARYDALVRQVAQTVDTPLIDCGAGLSFDSAAMHLDDGIHLTAEGQLWLARHVYAQLMPLLTE